MPMELSAIELRLFVVDGRGILILVISKEERLGGVAEAEEKVAADPLLLEWRCLEDEDLLPGPISLLPTALLSLLSPLPFFDFLSQDPGPNTESKMGKRSNPCNAPKTMTKKTILKNVIKT